MKPDNKKFLIDGRFLASQSTGIDRYAMEILKELDKVCSDVDISILVPANAIMIPDYKNIKIIKSKWSKWWTQGVFAYHAKKMKAMPINLCNEISTHAPDSIVCLHDVCYAEDVDYFPAEEASWFIELYRRVHKKACKVITVSEFSKSRIALFLRFNPDDILVAGNGWQHFEQVECNEQVFNQYPDITKKEYYFTLSSANKNKNVTWILENSKVNPDETYVVAGKGLDAMIDFSKYPNVMYVGYLDDADAKAFMKHCKAFIFPSLYEGFGIPPLEAMSVGATVIVSKVASLPEIFKKSAHYINPMRTDVKLSELMLEPIEDAKEILERYSWKNSAEKIHDMLLEIGGNRK